MLLLLKSGADPYATDSSGKSSLGLATSHISKMQTFIDVRNIYFISYEVILKIDNILSRFPTS